MKHSRAVLIAAISITLVFVFLRVFNISESLLFFGDIGRDHFVMQEWANTWKPPLLGPQTSALPFNQSAVYFYALFPFFILTGHSVYSTLIASLVYHVLALWVGVWVLKNNKQLLTMWLGAFALMAVHPQYVMQQRLVWNPSFVGVAVLISTVSFLLLQQKFTRMRIVIFGFSLALAVSLSYAVVPLVVAYLLLIVLVYRKQLRMVAQLIGSIVVGGVVWNAPTLFFEMRHGFVLTNMLLGGDRYTQIGSTALERLAQLSEWIFLVSPHNVVVGIILTVSSVFWLYAAISAQRKQMRSISFLLASAAVLFAIVPVTLHTHYIFPLTTLLFIWVAQHSRWLLGASIVVLVGMSVYSLPDYTKAARRTVAESHACVAQVCSSIENQPAFVSVNASSHDHFGYGFRFLLRDAGCEVRDVATEPTTANIMVVFADGAEYSHGVSDYFELGQFGESRETSVLSCTEHLQVHILEK